VLARAATEQFSAGRRASGHLCNTHLTAATPSIPDGFHSLYAGSQYMIPRLTYNAVVEGDMVFIYRVMPPNIFYNTDFAQQGNLISAFEAFQNYTNSFKFFYPALRFMPELARGSWTVDAVFGQGDYVRYEPREEATIKEDFYQYHHWVVPSIHIAV
jgi:hypothetical protein